MLPLPLRTDRLTIDRLAPADAPRLAAYRSDPAVARYQGWSAPFELARAEAFVAADARDEAGAPGTGVNLALRFADDPGRELVGDVYLAVPVSGPAEVGVTLSPAVQGRGLAAEAVAAVVEALERATTVEVVQAYVDTRNAPSLALFDRLGFARAEELAAGEGPDAVTEVRFVRRRGDTMRRQVAP